MLEQESLKRLGSTLSNTLHEKLAQAGADTQSHVLIDTRLRPLEPDHPIRIGALISARIAPNHPRLDKALCPEIYALDSSVPAGSHALASSAQESIAELQPESLQHGSGRRMGAWLQSQADISRIARHLAACLLHKHPESGNVTLLHLYDPAVLWGLWPHLDAAQRSALLGPISAWHILDPRGALVTLNAQTDSSRTRSTQSAPFALQENQWTFLEQITAINALLREPKELPASAQAMPIAALRDTLQAALQRAQRIGLKAQTDLVCFARLALRIAPDFDTHPRIAQLIASLGHDDYFCAAADELDDEEWQRIKEEFQAHA